MLDTAVFCFGRLQPPTIGHERLLLKVVEVAREQRADHYVFLSQTQKHPNDPLEWNYKRRVVELMFPGMHIVADPDIKTPFQALQELSKKYSKIIMIAGDDRAESFENRMSKYANEWGVTEFEVISSGARDPDAEGVTGMSASKARKFAIDGDYDNFLLSIPSRIPDNIKRDIYDKIKRSVDEDMSPEEYRRGSLRGKFIYSGDG